MDAARALSRQLRIRVLGTLVLVAVACWVSVRWLSSGEESVVLVASTVLAVCVAVSLLWLSPSGNGWLYLAAFLLAISPFALHEAAESLVLGSDAEAESCTITGVEARVGAADGLPGWQFLHHLECPQVGQKQLSWASRLGSTGQQTQIRYGANARQDPVPAASTAVDRDLAGAGLLLLGLIGSTQLASRRWAASTDPASGTASSTVG
jgi:hypothetical protein